MAAAPGGRATASLPSSPRLFDRVTTSAAGQKAKSPGCATVPARRQDALPLGYFVRLVIAWPATFRSIAVGRELCQMLRGRPKFRKFSRWQKTAHESHRRKFLRVKVGKELVLNVAQWSLLDVGRARKFASSRINWLDAGRKAAEKTWELFPWPSRVGPCPGRASPPTAAHR